MTDVFHSCEITPSGASFKVIRDGVNHRTAIGAGDFENNSDYVSAVLTALSEHLNVDPKLAEISSLESQQAAIAAKLATLNAALAKP